MTRSMLCSLAIFHASFSARTCMVHFCCWLRQGMPAAHCVRNVVWRLCAWADFARWYTGHVGASKQAASLGGLSLLAAVGRVQASDQHGAQLMRSMCMTSRARLLLQSTTQTENREGCSARAIWPQSIEPLAWCIIPL